jgi:hypothetical protein
MGFTIERSTEGGAFVVVGSSGPQGRKYTDTSVAPGTTYTYRVSAFNPGGSSVSPDASARTFAVPPYALRPGKYNTGPVGRPVLQASGEIEVTKDGAVIENLLVRGTILVRANNVTIRNVIVDAAGALYGIRCEDANFTGTLIEDVEVANAASTGVYGSHYTARRVHVHHIGADGFKAGDNVLIEASLVSHVGLTPGAHADGVQISGGIGIVIRGNRFDMPVDLTGTSSNGPVFIKPDFSAIDDVLIEDNWINGGNFSVFMADKVGAWATNVRVRGNYFGRDYRYGTARLGPGTVWEENYWADTGAPLP